MTQLVTATYTEPSVAQSAIGSVKTLGFTDEDIVQYASATGLVDTLYKLGLSRADAGLTAGKLAAGGVLVGVRTPFGHAFRVAKTLQSYQGGHVNVQKLSDPLDAIPSTPLSAIFKWPTLTTDAMPFSNFWRFPVLASFGTLSEKFGLASLSADAAPLSKIANMPTLTNGPFWISRVFGPLLLAKEDEWWR